MMSMMDSTTTVVMVMILFVVLTVGVLVIVRVIASREEKPGTVLGAPQERRTTAVERGDEPVGGRPPNPWRSDS